jgi:hypothetical protein
MQRPDSLIWHLAVLKVGHPALCCVFRAKRRLLDSADEHGFVEVRDFTWIGAKVEPNKPAQLVLSPYFVLESGLADGPLRLRVADITFLGTPSAKHAESVAALWRNVQPATPADVRRFGGDGRQ